MKTMKAGEFKAKCLGVMDEVAETGEEVIITKHGKPIAMLTAVSHRPESLFGILEGAVEIKGDIIDPIDEAWDRAS